MSLKSKRIEHLLHKASNPDDILDPQIGKVSIRKKKGSEWGNILVSPDLFSKRRSEALGDSIDEWLLPDIKPHISILTAEEVAQLPKNYSFPPTMEFILTGEIKVIVPETWKGVTQCIFEIVECVEVRRLRMSLGFSAYLYNDHEYHLTLGIKTH
jgi:hypothetical protein